MKRKKKGMSLVEVVVAMAIFVIIAMAITTTITFSIKMNANNRTKFQSNANSKTFIELIKNDNYRPMKQKIITPGPPITSWEGILSGWYYDSFKDDSELDIIVKNLETRAIEDDISVLPTFETCKVKAPPNTNDKYLMAIKVKWNDIDKIYEIDIMSWDLQKGEASNINRRILIAPK